LSLHFLYAAFYFILIQLIYLAECLNYGISNILYQLSYRNHEIIIIIENMFQDVENKIPK